MKKILNTIYILLASLILSGCIQIATKVNVNTDGSGTVEETVLMSDEVVQMLNEFAAGFTSDSTEVEEFKLFKEEELKSRAADLGEGVELVSGTELKTDGKQGYNVVYSFTDLNKLKIDQSPDSRIPDNTTGVETMEKSYVTFSFKKGDISELKVDLPEPKQDEDEVEEEMETEEDSTGNGDISEMKMLLKDLGFSLSLNINGEITETNADYREDSEITLLKLNFGELLDNPEKLEKLKKTDMNDVKELKEIMKDIPGIKIETNDPVIVKFR